jgi:uncharacterized repeat protein (TIGR02543 family)
MPIKSTIFIIIAVLFAGASYAAMKNVAVVETEIDPHSGAAAELTPAEVRQVTTELRREAVKNLPRGLYNIMTSETVMAQGGAVLVDCAEENCVIALGGRIGADYIVRGTVSKLQTRFTLSVEMYETENGNLVALSEAVRSENIAELIEKAAAACADMFKTFVREQMPAAPATNRLATPQPAIQYAITAAVNPAGGGSVSRNPHLSAYAPGTRVNVMAIPATGYAFTGWSGTGLQSADINDDNPLTVTMDENKMLTATFSRVREPKPKPEPNPETTLTATPDSAAKPERKPLTGFTLGAVSCGGGTIVQIGAAHYRPALVYGDIMSFNVEGNIWIGSAYGYTPEEASDIFGFNLPLTALLQLSVFSLEAGVHGDLLFSDATLFNAGFVAGAGIGFNKKRSRRYFVRYSGGNKYFAVIAGMRWLF